MTAPTHPESGFFRLLLTSFRYPFHGDGLFLIIGGAVFFTAADFVSTHASIMAIFIQAVVFGYLAAYAKDVVRTSAMGEDTPPGWADFSDWIEDILVPVFQFLLVLALSFGLLVFLQFKHPFNDNLERVALFAAGSWGCLILPILFLAVAMTDSSLAAINPVPLVRAVVLTLPNYLLTCLLFAAMLGLGFAVSVLQGFASRIPILPDLVGWVCVLYLITAIMRSFGLLYRLNHERLQWY
jgi:hypothetical protein